MGRLLFSCIAVTVLCASVSMALSSYHPSGLTVGFYQSTCPQAEEIVRSTVAKAVSDDPGVAADFLRMHFHDCFVRGCDGSILLNSTKKSTAEKDHPVNNPSLEGFDVIDQIKAKLEAACPNTVSCADIIAFTARDSIVLSGMNHYDVPAGRRDGKISRASDVPKNLPPPTFTVKQLIANFARKGLSVDEMVTLSGAHSIGKSHCSSFTSRLYSFNNTVATDPTLDPAYAASLKQQCPSNANTDNTVPLETISPLRLDNVYYKELLRNRGLLASDERLFTSPVTKGLVLNNAIYGTVWAEKFTRAIIHMGTLDVLTGTKGEIRKNCGVVN
ncbi:hypothetical protein SAY87_010115 [Trapa incisa]|uniref:Peroxidase n=1 Tax=Trapa incisa TaxID=236973 RepID=A0AAN7GGN4_9MYRT|nr:hypothetical protein SAY87_010115 [Trapa incisa]